MGIEKLDGMQTSERETRTKTRCATESPKEPGRRRRRKPQEAAAAFLVPLDFGPRMRGRGMTRIRF